MRQWKWDREEAAELFRSGNTLDEIAVKYAITRESVRQGLTKFLGDHYQAIKLQNRQNRKKPEPEYLTRSCFVCGVDIPGRWLSRPRFSFCPTHHVEVPRGAIVRLCDPVRRDQHLAFVRRVQGRPDPTYSNPTWAHRTDRNRLNRGSRLHGLVTEAYQRGWPLFTGCPVEIQDQIRREASEE